MAESSRRAGRSAKRGSLSNALFVVAAAEALPAELDGRADALTIHFPWGSLLRGLLDADDAIVAGIARVTRPGATVSILLSVTPRDHLNGRTSLDERTFTALVPSYAAHGLLLREARPATAEDLAQSSSTWAKRLGAGRDRSAWLVWFQRDGTGSGRASTEQPDRFRPSTSSPRRVGRQGRTPAEPSGLASGTSL